MLKCWIVWATIIFEVCFGMIISALEITVKYSIFAHVVWLPSIEFTFIYRFMWTEHTFFIACLAKSVSMTLFPIWGKGKQFTSQAFSAFLHQRDPDNPLLVKMLNVCDLLSLCAEGRKKYPEDVCQEVFSMDNLLKWEIHVCH